MPLVIRDYVTECSGDEADRFEKMREMHAFIEPLIDERGLAFNASVLSSEQEIDNSLLDPAEVLGATGGVLPVIWINTYFRPDQMSREELRPFEERYRLKLLGEFVDESAS